MSGRALILVALAALAAGCQSATFDVKVDLYGENPRAIVPMTPETATGLVEDIERLRASATQKNALRLELASTAWQIYQQAWIDAGLSRGESSGFESHRRQHEAYVKAAKKAYEDLTKAEGPLDNAVGQLTGYAAAYAEAYDVALGQFKECERYRLKGRWQQRSQRKADEAAGKDTTFLPCSPYERRKDRSVERLDDEWVVRRLPIELRRREAVVRSAVALAVEKYRGFAGPVGESFVIDWAGLRAKLYSRIEAARRAERESEEMTHRRALFALDGRIATLAGTSNLIPKRRIEDAVEKNAQGAATGLFDSMLKIAVELESLRADLPDDASAQTALASLVRNSSRFTELIDRLQDSGDPVWRIITDPANEAHWNPQSVGTHFYAQGHSSAVIVRHDPMRYDIHEATNNPLALVKGQLAISHAVSKAAINIASAATGLPAPAPKDDGEGGAGGSADTPGPVDTSAADAFAKKKAEADEAERTRERALRGLSQELSSIHATLAASPNDANVLRTQKARLESVLQAYRVLFESLAN
jgi:hypothetical protein